MKIAQQNVDFLEITESNLKTYLPKTKVHLLKVSLNNPDESTLHSIVKKFNFTNRFIISDNIRFYNEFFKKVGKKYYVENKKSDNLITFFRKNNKIAFNFTVLSDLELKFMVNNLEDILYNVEVIITSGPFYISNKEIIDSWSGNLIIKDDE